MSYQIPSNGQGLREFGLDRYRQLADEAERQRLAKQASGSAEQARFDFAPMVAIALTLSALVTVGSLV
ncbi:MAG TPA: hypothetical protein VGA52_06855 [Anaerolineales bacterium]|jgi:hypothetical protein